MTDKPKIYATCPAGCLWETIHKSDFEKSAAYIPIKIEDEGNFFLDKGKTYRINTIKNETGELFGSWGFNICISVWWETSGPQYHEEIVTLPAFDKYSQSVKFRLHAVERSISEMVPYIFCHYDLNGERKTFAIEADSSSTNIGVSVSVEPTVNAQVEVLLMNEDAQTRAVDGVDGKSAFFAYSFNADGTNFTREWQEGQCYLGVASADSAPLDKSGYEWIYIAGGGKTPVKGTDYFTQEDIAEIAAAVIGSLGGNPVFGYIDENNNFVLSGNIPDGTYTASYEKEDGSIVALVGELVKDTNTYYSITNNLTNCTNGNSATSIVEGGSYSATVSANSGYELSSVVVTMGGDPVTVTGGNINIANVTGNIVITAVATETVVTPSYTNVLPLSVDTDGSDYKGTNGEDGYKVGYRLSKSANGGEVAQAGMCCSGFIPAITTDIIKIKNIIEYAATAGWNLVLFYDSAKTYLSATTLLIENTLMNYADGVYTFKPNSFDNAYNTAFIRFVCGTITDETIVTINEKEA